MTNRIQVKETNLVGVYSFEGTLENIIAMLQDWKEEGKWEGIDLGYYDDELLYHLYRHRPETDKEYEKLKKEFGNDS